MPLETVFHHQNRHEVLTGMQVLMPMSGMLIPSLTSSRVIVFQYKFSCSILLVLSLSLLMSLMINAVVGESSFDTSSNYHIDRWCCCASVSLLIFSWEDFGLLESVVHQHAVRDVVLQETSRVSFSAQVIIVIRFLGFFFSSAQLSLDPFMSWGRDHVMLLLFELQHRQTVHLTLSVSQRYFRCQYLIFRSRRLLSSLPNSFPGMSLIMNI